MEVIQTPYERLTSEEQGRLLVNIQYLQFSKAIKFTVQELHLVDLALALKVSHQDAKLLNGAATMLVLHGLRKKVMARWQRISRQRKPQGQMSLTVAEWIALREILLYHPWDSFLIRSALGKIDQALPISCTIPIQ